MFTTENLKKGAFTLVVVLAALSIHQLVIAPRLVKKAKIGA